MTANNYQILQQSVAGSEAGKKIKGRETSEVEESKSLRASRLKKSMVGKRHLEISTDNQNITFNQGSLVQPSQTPKFEENA